MTLIGEWSFITCTPSRERTSNWGELELFGAQITPAGLQLAGGAHARVRNYTGPAIADKTLVVWLRLDSVADARPAGSAMTLDARSVDRFDGIVFGEREDRTWMAGSTNFVRSRNLGATAAETRAGETLQMAATYAADGTGARVSLYRNGVLLGSYTQGPLATWQANDAEILFGARHTSDQEVRGKLTATIFGAQLHGRALTEEQIESLTCPGLIDPVAPPFGEDVVLESVARPGHFLTVNGGSSAFESPTAVFRRPADPADLSAFKLRIQPSSAGVLLYWTNLPLGHHGWCGKFGAGGSVQQLAGGVDGQFGTVSLHQGYNPWGQLEYWRLAPTRGYGTVTLTDALELAHRTAAPTTDADKALYSFRLRRV